MSVLLLFEVFDMLVHLMSLISIIHRMHMVLDWLILILARTTLVNNLLRVVVITRHSIVVIWVPLSKRWSLHSWSLWRHIDPHLERTLILELTLIGNLVILGLP
jgi:hypothetical protein